MKTSKSLPSQEVLKSLLTYNPLTGELFWKPRPREMFSRDQDWKMWNTQNAGEMALSTPIDAGYLVGTINGTRYRTHRIIWRLETGRIPDQIDHENGDRKDNRWANLKDVSGPLNQRNMKCSSRNSSGVVGVAWLANTKKWRALISGNHLGCFETFDEAVAARKAAELKHNFHPNHGRAA